MAQQTKVTIADIEANIKDEYYFTGDQAAFGAYGPAQHDENIKLVTFCMLVCQNGFIATGKSTCAHASTFDAEIGKRLAKIKALDEVWLGMGYALKDKLHKGTSGFECLP